MKTARSLENAIKKYANGKISTWKAAEIARIPLRKMNDKLLEKGISIHYSKQSLKEDLGLVNKRLHVKSEEYAYREIKGR